MKYFISLLVFKILWVIILFQNKIYCQNIEGVYFLKDGFCSNSIILGSNNLAFKEGGCEGRSHINWGTWQQNKDTIQLESWNVGRKYPFLKQIDYTKDSTNRLSIIVLDIFGNDISKYINLKFNLSNNDSIYYVSKDDDFTMYELHPKIGNVKPSICKKVSDIVPDNIKTIEILRINMMIGEKFMIDVKQGNNIKIQFNFPSDFFYYPTVMHDEEWYKMEDVLIISDSCLIKDNYRYNKLRKSP